MRIGVRVVRLGAVASTNDEAARLAAAGAPAGTAVVADEQLAGRGRHGRAWHSPPGDNIYCSVILRPARPFPEWPTLSWTLAAAVASFARACGAEAAAVKRPNDVLVHGRKVAGLLLETRTCGEGQSALVAGIGVNVNNREGDFPPGLRAPATSLAVLTGRRRERDELLPLLFAQLDSWYALWEREGADATGKRLVSAGLGEAGDADGADRALAVAGHVPGGEGR